jgi:hypothetical protein
MKKLFLIPIVLMGTYSCTKQIINTKSNSLAGTTNNQSNQLQLDMIMGKESNVEIAGEGWVIQMTGKPSYLAKKCTASIKKIDQDNIEIRVKIGDRDTFGFPLKLYSDFTVEKNSENYIFSGNDYRWTGEKGQDSIFYTGIEIEWVGGTWPPMNDRIASVQVAVWKTESDKHKFQDMAKCATKDYIENATGIKKLLNDLRDMLKALPASKDVGINHYSAIAENLNHSFHMSVPNRLSKLVSIRYDLYSNLDSTETRRSDLTVLDLKKDPL